MNVKKTSVFSVMKSQVLNHFVWPATFGVDSHVRKCALELHDEDFSQNLVVETWLHKMRNTMFAV